MENDLTVKLSGINYDDLRDILTAASLHHYETENEIADKKPESTEHWLREVETENIAAEVVWEGGRPALPFLELQGVSQLY
jgi:hypothetical protein